MKANTLWKIITVIELVAVVVVVLRDLFLPTLVLLGMLVISLLIRHEPAATLGFKSTPSWPKVAGWTLLGAVCLQLFDVGVLMPILNRVTGTTIDYSGFAQLKGNLGQLLLFLALSWTLAAMGEEIAYRGYVQKLLTDLFGDGPSGVWLTVGLSSLMFGLAHTEQGLIGVVVTTVDALFYSWLKRKFDGNLWATILAHGFYNSVGMIVFYFAGPIYGLW